MFYKSDFIQKPLNLLPDSIVQNNFTVLLCNDQDSTQNLSFSVSRAAKPLSYISAILAMKPFRYSKNTVLELNIFNKIYCLLIILSFVLLSFYVRPVGLKQTATDIPLNLLTKTFTVFQSSELMYYVFIISFGNSKHYIHLYQIIDSIDIHFGHTKTTYRKRVVLAIIIAMCPCIVVPTLLLIRPFQFHHIISYVTFTFVNFHGFNTMFVTFIIYIQILIFNEVLRQKIRNLPSSKAIIFRDDFITYIFKVKLLSYKCFYGFRID